MSPPYVLISFAGFLREKGVERSMFCEMFGSSKNVRKSFAIHPQAQISNLGIIKIQKNLKQTIHNKNKIQKKRPIVCPCRAPIEHRLFMELHGFTIDIHGESMEFHGLLVIRGPSMDNPCISMASPWMDICGYPWIIGEIIGKS